MVVVGVEDDREEVVGKGAVPIQRIGAHLVGIGVVHAAGDVEVLIVVCYPNLGPLRG